MPIEIAHYTLISDEKGRQENYRVLRIIQPGDTDILFDAGDITGVSEPLRFWGERMEGNKLVSPAYFIRGADPLKGCHHPSPYVYRYSITGGGCKKLRKRSIQPTPS